MKIASRFLFAAVVTLLAWPTKAATPVREEMFVKIGLIEQ